MVQPLWGKIWKFLKKLNIQLPDYPEISLLGVYSSMIVRNIRPQKEWSKRVWHITQHCQEADTTRCSSIDKQINKRLYISTTETYLVIKMN